MSPFSQSRPWRWIINDQYRLIVQQSLQFGTALFDALDRIEQTTDGYPQEGEYSIEDDDGNIGRWNVAQYEILHERLTRNRYLLMAAIRHD